MPKSDAMVSLNDLTQAIEEKRRGYNRATMARLLKTEPHLSIYLENLAAHFNNPTGQKEIDLDGMGKALDHLLVIVRAVEIGQYRLWHDSIPANSPLGQMIGLHPENGSKGEQTKS